MTIYPLNHPDLLYVASSMREWDKREIYSTRPDESPELLARDIMMLGDFGWIFGVDGEPIVALGAVPIWPGVWSVWMFGTDKLPLVGKKVTSWVRRAMIPALLSVGCHRAECNSMEGHTDAHRWLEHLGARRGNKVVAYGKNQENFYNYSWLPDTNIKSRYVFRGR